MARKLKRKIRRTINRTRKAVCLLGGCALFGALFFEEKLPGLGLLHPEASELRRDAVIAHGYENYVSSRKVSKRPFFAHRGFSSIGLENSLSAFDLAVERGYEQLEMDVWKSADGVLYVCHNDSLESTASEKLKITQTESSRLDQVVLNNNEPLPRLSDVFDDLADQAVYLIELKTGRDETAEFIDLVRQYEPIQSRICVQAWNLDALSHIEQELPYMFTMLLMPDLEQLDAALADQHLSGLAISHNALNASVIDKIHQAGKQCWAWTVNDYSRMRELVSQNVDGLISDHPDWAAAAYEQS